MTEGGVSRTNAAEIFEPSEAIPGRACDENAEVYQWMLMHDNRQ